MKNQPPGDALEIPEHCPSLLLFRYPFSSARSLRGKCLVFLLSHGLTTRPFFGLSSSLREKSPPPPDFSFFFSYIDGVFLWCGPPPLFWAVFFFPPLSVLWWTGRFMGCSDGDSICLHLPFCFRLPPPLFLSFSKD